MSQPEFIVTENARGKLVTCLLDGEVGTARVFSAGVLDACQRAEEQARQKVSERGPAE